MTKIAELFAKIIEDTAPTHRQWVAVELDAIQNSGVTLDYNNDIGVIIVSNHLAGGTVGESLNHLYSLALLTKQTVVSSMNGRIVTIAGKDRHG